jgi:hypothetical protein
MGFVLCLLMGTFCFSLVCIDIVVNISLNHIGGVMINMIASSVVDHGFEPTSDQTKDCKIPICRFSNKHASFRSKSKECLARNQDNVSEWSIMSIHGLLF